MTQSTHQYLEPFLFIIPPQDPGTEIPLPNDPMQPEPPVEIPPRLPDDGNDLPPPVEVPYPPEPPEPEPS